MRHAGLRAAKRGSIARRSQRPNDDLRQAARQALHDAAAR